MVPIETSGASQLIAGVIIIVVGALYGVQKLPKMLKEGKIEQSLVEMMHNELLRLSSQNTILATELNKLQYFVLQFHN